MDLSLFYFISLSCICKYHCVISLIQYPYEEDEWISYLGQFRVICIWTLVDRFISRLNISAFVVKVFVVLMIAYVSCFRAVQLLPWGCSTRTSEGSPWGSQDRDSPVREQGRPWHQLEAAPVPCIRHLPGDGSGLRSSQEFKPASQGQYLDHLWIALVAS